MRSKAHFRGHPLHPALVHFPLAFLIGAFGFDLAGRGFGNPTLWGVGYWLSGIGVLTALLAALPGFLDYFYTVPPKSSGKRRATQHMLVNLAAVGLFAAAWLIRGGEALQPGIPVLLAEGAGAVLLSIGGFLGGVLLTRNQIGVDHRYAEAGKWREDWLEPERGASGGGLVAATLGELEVDQMKLLHVGDRRIALVRTEDGYTAFDDRCTHRGGSLADGVVISGQVQCPWHGSQFDVRTGAVCNGPATEPIRTYRVEVRGADILVHLESPGPQPKPGRPVPVTR